MNKAKVKTISTVASLLVIFLVISTLAYFTSSDTVTNRFTVGDLSVEVNESGYKDEQVIAYGQKIAKAPCVENKGKNDAVVFLEVRIPKAAGLMFYENNSVTTKTNATELFKTLYNSNDGINSADWVQIDSTDITNDKYNTYVYGYKKVLPHGDKSTALFTQVMLNSLFELDDTDSSQNALLNNYQDIMVIAHGIQSEYLSDDSGSISYASNTAINGEELARIWKLVPKGSDGA